MAETALSILGSAIGKAATAATEEMSLLMGVQEEIWFMKDEMKTMQAFLIAAEAMKKKKKKRPLSKVWEEQVRSLSYDIEDCLDEFMVHVGSQSLSQQLMRLKDRHRIAVQIRNLKSRVEEVSSRNTRYNLIQMEDTNIEIKRKRLVDRWIAEGFVKARVGMTIEDVGKRYFNELIGRSMIQPSKVNIEGIVKRCQVHDIMRDIIVSLSREEGFVYTSGDSVPNLVEEHFRHVAYHDSKCSFVRMDWGRVRSLTVFGERPVEHAPSLCSPQLRMIRALDLENVDFAVTQKDISNIGLLRHLKYVNIHRLPSIYALPRSIGKLQGLQSLEVYGSYISTLPTEICKLKSLRTLSFIRDPGYKFFDQNETVKWLMHSLCLPMIVFFYQNEPVKWLMHSLCLHMIFTPFVDLEVRDERIASVTGGVKVPRGIGTLKGLQTLGDVDIKRTSSKAIGELGELSQLRKLSVSAYGATEKKCVTLCKAIQKLSSLGSLHIFATNGTLEWLDSVSFPPWLRTLVLAGCIGDKIDRFRNLTQLVKLHLWYSRLEEGKAVEIIGALPNLMLLDLRASAYAGKELVFRQGAFRNLRKLCFSSTELREIRFEQGASPKMESIHLDFWGYLFLGINGIKHLPKIKEIYLGYNVKVARLGMLQKEVNAHRNQPVLRLARDQRYHDLGDPEGSDEYFDAVESLPDHDGEGSEVTTPAASDS